jgi:hypothetical protein
MANTSNTEMIVQGASLAVIIPATLTSGKISALGTAILHEAITDASVMVPAAASSKTEYISTTLANGVTVEVEKNSMTLDGVTGSEKSGSGSDSKCKIAFTTNEVCRAAYKELVDLSIAGTPCIVCIGLGEKPSGDQDGYAFLLAKITNDLERSAKGNEYQTLKVEFSATTGVADTGFDETDINTAFAIGANPMGGDAITAILHAAAQTPPPASNEFASADVTDLLAGKVVLKAA